MSAVAFIIITKFSDNLTDGIVLQASRHLRNDTVIKLNEITRNKENGILCIGEGNFARIEKNYNISCNKRAGVKASEKASPLML